VSLVCWAIQAYTVVIIARIVLSWFPLSQGGIVSSIYGVLFSVTEPVLGSIRRVVPAINLGGMGLDLSPLIVLFGLQILSGFIC
jgi:YggT family protein